MVECVRPSPRSHAVWPSALMDRAGLQPQGPASPAPARLADLIRGQWAIENGLHYVRDVTFTEDASQVRTESGPQVIACLGNLVIGVLSRAGPVNLAAAAPSQP